ncbi:MAG: hypothetical protein HQL81_11075 [Magnetococcales bacterium]|nr:hypothetical protein [Magnetococcales bacterium]MBF0632302.1 hypothetical protein [Magnetococcales bacterium]
MTPHIPEPDTDPRFEQVLNQRLAELPLETPSHRLRANVLALAEQSTGEVHRWWWPFGPLWRPAFVLACSALLGLGLGTTWSQTPPAQEFIGSETITLIFGPMEEAP